MHGASDFERIPSPPTNAVKTQSIACICKEKKKEENGVDDLFLCQIFTVYYFSSLKLKLAKIDIFAALVPQWVNWLTVLRHLSHIQDID